MIDLHCHILPGVDDGPATMDEAVAMARMAYEDGVRTIVATPHVSHDYPLDPREIPERVAEVNTAFAGAGVGVTVVRGAEVALSRVLDLDQAMLESACIGEGRYLLVEPPYQYTGESLERILFDITVAGFLPVLAHPERSACFAGRVERLAEVVGRGAVSSVTAASVAGRFGKPVRAAAREMLAAGLAHDVASDGHGTERRTPRLSPAADGHDPAEWEWLTVAVPRAIVAGQELPQRPERAEQGGLLARLRRR